MPFIGKAPETGAFRLIDSITTSATDTYALTVQGDYYFPASARNLIVSLNGVTQAPESAYTVSGSHIVFASALTANDVIDYILVIGDAVDIGTPSDGTVGNAQLKASLDFSGKTLTFSNDQISGDAVDGGTISNFASTGIDDNATSTALTVTDSGIAATLTTAAQPNITSVGTLSALSVTGDLTVDTNTLVVDSTNNNVGIGTNSPNSYLEYNGLTINGGNQGGFVDFEINGTLVGEIFTESVAGVSTLVIDTVGSTTDIQFRTDANDRMRIDSSGVVSIYDSTGANRNLEIYSSGTSGFLKGRRGVTTEIELGAADITFDSGGSTIMTMKNGGNVGIKTAQPVSLLDVLHTAPKITANSNSFATSGNGTGFGIYRSAFGRQAGYTWTIENAVLSGGSTSADYQIDSLVFKARVGVTDSSLTDRLILQPNGNVEIVDGDLTVANGHGISFAATGNISGTSSELLDDYEEGTWYAHVRDSATNNIVINSAAVSFYKKVGNIVTLHIVTYANSVSAHTFTGYPYIELPFNPALDNSGNGGYIPYYLVGMGTIVSGYVFQSNGNKFYLATDASTPFSSAAYQFALSAGNKRFYGQLIYNT